MKSKNSTFSREVEKFFNKYEISLIEGMLSKEQKIEDEEKKEEIIKALDHVVDEFVSIQKQKIATDIKEISEKYKAAVFWKVIQDEAKKRMRPYVETEFIKNMSDPVLYLKQSFFLWFHREPDISSIQKKFQITEKQQNVTNAVFNTVNKYIAEDNMQKNQFVRKCESIFGFESSISDELWSDLEPHKDYLLLRRIMQRLDSVETSFSKMVDIFSEAFISQEDDDKEDSNE